MGANINNLATVQPVEPADLSDESIDSQCVQLAQARLDGRIDEETYARLLSLLKGERATQGWKPSESIEYATPAPGKSRFAVMRRTAEVIGVCVLILMVLSIAVPRVTPISRDPQITAVKVDIANLEAALDAFKADTGRYPTSSEGLAALMHAPANVGGTWSSPYIKITAVPVDPWGHTYIYNFPSIHVPNGHELMSAGKDGVVGTPR
jgi:general secretion pathway protein G